MSFSISIHSFCSFEKYPNDSFPEEPAKTVAPDRVWRYTNEIMIKKSE